MSNYKDKKAFFEKILTVYGRQSVLEALQDGSLKVYKLHLATSNKEGSVDQIISLAKQRHIEIEMHDKKGLSRISKNGKQDQGVALDLMLETMMSLEQFLARVTKPFKLIALDGVENPQNIGMIIRSVAASTFDGVLLPKKGTPAISPLMIKASAGTLFKAPLIRVESLETALAQIKNVDIVTLKPDAIETLYSFEPLGSVIYVLGNEHSGVSQEVDNLATVSLSIPMQREVESLNVAVTAGIISFMK
jgi:23S rRNA (guanosine2251-2'-O)-methyltransferase